jgi:hypothetical protein
MGFFDGVKQAVGGGGDSKPNVEMTEVGDKKLVELQATGAEYIVLSAIKRHSPCVADEITKDPQVKLSHDQVCTVLGNLESKGWIRRSRIA